MVCICWERGVTLCSIGSYSVATTLKETSSPMLVAINAYGSSNNSFFKKIQCNILNKVSVLTISKGIIQCYESQSQCCLGFRTIS